jgi:hypothetical protein
LSDIAVHILAEHDSEIVEVPAHFRVELLDFVERSRYRKVVINLGEIFYLTWKKEGNILKFGVFHFRPINENSYFKYGIKIGNSEYCVSATRNCHNYLDGGLTELRHKDCVPLYYNPVLDCLNASGYLSCEIEIGKKKLDGFVSDELQELLQDAFAIGSDSEIEREMLGIPPPTGQSQRPPPPYASPVSLPSRPPTPPSTPPQFSPESLIHSKPIPFYKRILKKKRHKDDRF